MVLVDTSVWSLALRRRSGVLSSTERAVITEWADLVGEGRVRLIGPIRQEILSGVRDAGQFAALRERLNAFRDTEIEAADYVRAAEFFNRCRTRGLTGTSADLLICSVAHRLRWPIFSTDRDFVRYAEVLPLRLHAVPAPDKPSR